MAGEPVRWIGRVEMRPTPIAILTARGTVRTRRRVPQLAQVYPKASPAEWAAEGHAVVSVSCIACMAHSGDVELSALPPGQGWASVGRRFLCTACGMPGAVNIVPNWLFHRDHVRP